MLQARITRTGFLRFDDGAPVRAASAIARFGNGWLIAQDDATHAAWRTGNSTRRLRLLPPIEGHDVFSEAEETKHLKPDFEAACEVPLQARTAVLLLGSGSTPARMRSALVSLENDRPHVRVADLSPLYDLTARCLDVDPDGLNLEGSCLIGDRLRWFNRGNLHAGIPSCSVDVELGALLAAATGDGDPGAVPVTSVRFYEFGEVEGIGLAVTDAVALPDGRVLVSTAAEDTPNAVDDGEVVGGALCLLDGDEVVGQAPLSTAEDGTPWKVEGLALQHLTADDAQLVAVVDADAPQAPSAELALHARWG